MPTGASLPLRFESSDHRDDTNRATSDSPDFLSYVGGINLLTERSTRLQETSNVKIDFAQKNPLAINPEGTVITRENGAVRVKHRDGSTFTTKQNRDGSIDFIGSGKAPSDNYFIHQSPEGSYFAKDSKGSPIDGSSSADVLAQHRRLDALSNNFANAEDKARFRADMNRLGSRMRGNETEISQTYSAVAELLEQRSQAKVKPEVVDRLAMDVMSHAGISKSIDQGPHPTCNVSSIESVMYHDSPSVPAEVIKDLALTGEHTLPNGQVVRVDEQSLQAASLSRRADGDRSLATQYMNVLMVNTALAKKGEHYTSDDRRIREVDERSPQVVGKAPGLGLAEIAQSYKAIMGTKAKPTVIIAHESEASRDEHGKIIPIDGVEYYGDQKSYEQLLDRLKKTQGLPVAELIDVRNNFSPPGRYCAGPKDEDKYDAHLLDIDDINGGVVDINNQWGSACRYPLPAKQAYEASIDKELSIIARIDKAKANGSRDFAAELEHSHTLMRQLGDIPNMRPTGEQVLSNLDFYIREAQAMPKKLRATAFGTEAAKAFANFAVDMLPLEDRAKAAERMRASGLFEKTQELIDTVGDIS